MAGAQFLTLFDRDPDEAARKCEALRRKLVFYFQHHLSRDPEDDAQEVLLRLEQKSLADLGGYDDLVRLSFGFARNVAAEHRRRSGRFEELPEDLDREIRISTKEKSPEDYVLDKEREDMVRACLLTLSSEDRQLFLSWYLEEKTDHKGHADRLQVSANGLRIRIHRLLRRVQDCVAKRSRKQKG
jgi:DNA-directed RNA polymerase specialized sigma24 family protein